MSGLFPDLAAVTAALARAHRPGGAGGRRAAPTRAAAPGTAPGQCGDRSISGSFFTSVCWSHSSYGIKPCIISSVSVLLLRLPHHMFVSSLSYLSRQFGVVQKQKQRFGVVSFTTDTTDDTSPYRLHLFPPASDSLLSHLMGVRVPCVYPDWDACPPRSRSRSPRKTSRSPRRTGSSRSPTRSSRRD